MAQYGLVMLGAALCGLLIMILRREKTEMDLKTVFVFGALAVPLCVLAGRAAFWLCSLSWITDSDRRFWDFLGSGYSYMLYGAIIGGFLAAFLASKITGTPFGRIADAAAAPAALLVAAGRFAEYMIDAGFGTSVEAWFDPYENWSMIAWEDPSPICRFPFAVQNYYGTWRFSINLLEGIAALVFLVVLLVMKKRRSGGAASMFLLMYASCQILFESMRRDEVVIWGFVKANQLISAILVALLLVFFWLKTAPEKRTQAELWIRLALVVLLAGVGMLMEFALDEKIEFLHWMRADLSYIVLALCCAGMLAVALPLWRRAFPKEE